MPATDRNSATRLCAGDDVRRETLTGDDAASVDMDSPTTTTRTTAAANLIVNYPNAWRRQTRMGLEKFEVRTPQ